MYSYELYYQKMIDGLATLKKWHLYNIPKLKGALYKYYTKKANSEFEELTIDEMKKIKPNSDDKVIVSLTTYGERTNIVHVTIDTILRQNISPQKVILWLSEIEFPNRERDLPRKLLERWINCPIFEIGFCEDLKPHKKYYETMAQFPDYTTVTADDDVFYPSNWLESLIQLNKQYPNYISCTVAHEMTFSAEGNIKNYSEWVHQSKKEGPSFLLCPVGVGGVLYPPFSLNKDIFKKDVIFKTCLYADDLWLKVMSLLNNTPVVRTSAFGYGFLTVNGAEKTALSISNVKENKNDLQLKQLMDIYGEQVKKVIENDFHCDISCS